MKQKLEQVLSKKLLEVVSYLFFGGLTTVVNIIVHFIFLDFFGVHYLVATVISWIAAVLFAIVTNKRWVFHSKTTSQQALIREFLTFVFYRLLSLVMDMGAMFVLVEVLKTGDVAAKIVTQVLVVVVNYLFSKFLIFGRK